MPQVKETGHRQMSKSDEILEFLVGFMLDYGGDADGRVTLNEPWYVGSPFGFTTMVGLGYCKENNLGRWSITQAGLDYIAQGGKDG